MLRRAGIVRRTFLFVGLLIVLVTLVSFAILYFAMPPYYRYKKEESLKAGTEQLEAELKVSTDRDECAALIAAYTEEYNVTVTTIGADGKTLMALSSPFVSLKSNEAGHNQMIINGRTAEEESFSAALEEIYLILRPDQDEEGKTTVTVSNENMEAYIMYDIGTEMFFDADIGTGLISKIQVQGTLQPIEEARGVIFSLIPYALAAGTAIGLCLAWIYARQISKPILTLSATAERMKNMEPGAVSGLKTNDELGILSENLDALYQSLSETIGSLKDEMEKVNRLEQSKTEMMQSASHELKTPIAALSGMLDGMLDNIGAYKDKDKYLVKCKEQVEKLSFLVKEILDASRADTGRGEEMCTDTEVDEVIRRILTEYDLLIKEKSLRLITRIDKAVLWTETESLARVIANLVGNAVLYTPAGGEIRIVLSEELLQIENECKEIPEEELDKLFEPFYTRSSSRDRTENGTGLGLYIVKRNLERLSIPYRAENTRIGFRITLFFYNPVSGLSAQVPARP